MDSQGMMMLKLKDDRATEISIADPSRKLKRVMVTIPGIYEKAGTGYSLYPDETKKQTLMIVDLPQGVYAGKSVTIKFGN
jgi:chondroitin AC lyase